MATHQRGHFPSDGAAPKSSEAPFASATPGGVFIIAACILTWASVEALRVVDRLNADGLLLKSPALVKHMTLSVLWATVGFVGIVGGFFLRNAPTRYAALAILTVAFAKIILIDMASVETVWRVLTFVLVGGLLMGVSFIYHRHQNHTSVAN